MNFDQIAAELVRAVRGERSQTLLSRRLGFRGNQLRRWETGERKVAWEDFVRLAETCGVPLDEAVRKVLAIYDGGLDGNHLVRRLIGGASQTKVSQATGLSRYAILRWMNDKSAPALDDVLALVHTCQYLLIEFIAYLVDIQSVPSAYAEYEVRRARKQVYYRHPVAPAVICCLKLDDYQALAGHQPGYVAAKLRIPRAEEEAVLAELLKVGKIVHDGTRYQVTEEQLELTDSKEIRSWCAYWLDRSATVMREEESPFRMLNCGLDLYPTSAKTLEKVRNEYVRYFQTVRALLAQDQGPRDMVCVFTSLFVDFSAKTDAGPDALRENRRPGRKPRATGGESRET